MRDLAMLPLQLSGFVRVERRAPIAAPPAPVPIAEPTVADGFERGGTYTPPVAPGAKLAGAKIAFSYPIAPAMAEKALGRLLDASTTASSGGAPKEGAKFAGSRKLDFDLAKADALAKLDTNRSGAITDDEVKAAKKDKTGGGRAAYDSLSEGDRAVLDALGSREGADLAFANGDAFSWAAADRMTGAAKNAKAPAVVGSNAQTTADDPVNPYCGAAGALFLAQGGAVNLGEAAKHPTTGKPMTYAESDALMKKWYADAKDDDGVGFSGGSTTGSGYGTTYEEQLGLLKDHVKWGGAKSCHGIEWSQVEVDSPESFAAEIERGLDSDPRGVMFMMNDHWVVATAIDRASGKLKYYDPAAAADGKSQIVEADVDAVAGKLSPAWVSSMGVPHFAVITGTRVGALYGSPVGDSARKVGEVTGLYDSEVTIKPYSRDHKDFGVFETLAAAKERAAEAAKFSNQDAIIRKEGDAYAVYPIDEISGLSSAVVTSRFETTDPDVIALFRGGPKATEVKPTLVSAY